MALGEARAPCALRGSANALTSACEMSMFLSISYGFFVDLQSTFMTADELLHHKFDVFRNSDVRTDRGRPLSFGCHASAINLLQQPVHACPGQILPGKLSQQTL